MLAWRSVATKVSPMNVRMCECIRCLDSASSSQGCRRSVDDYTSETRSDTFDDDKCHCHGSSRCPIDRNNDQAEHCWQTAGNQYTSTIHDVFIESKSHSMFVRRTSIRLDRVDLQYDFQCSEKQVHRSERQNEGLHDEHIVERRCPCCAQVNTCTNER
jgi:hypothetical protein